MKILKKLIIKEMKMLNENVYIGYHGSDNHITGNFKNLNPNITGFFFSSDYENAKTYGNNVNRYKLRINNPLIIDASGLKFTDDIPVKVIANYPDEPPYETMVSLPIDEIAYMVKNGKRSNQLIDIKDRENYDGIIFKNIIDPSLSSRREIPQNTIVVFDNSQIERIDLRNIVKETIIEHLKENSDNNIGNIVYSAVFFNRNDLVSMFPQVYPNLYSHHSTIEFKPTTISNLPIGQRLNIKVIGRLTTDKVDVIIVENPLSKNKFPHITLSTDEGVKPFESNSEIENNQDKIKPLNATIIGIVGVFDGKNKITNL